MNNIDLLKDISEQIKEINRKRFVSEDNQEKEVLDLSLIALKEAERVEVARLSGEIIEKMEEVGAKLKAYAKEIRERVTRMSQFQKDVDSVESVAKGVLRVIDAVLEWIIK